jgi:hypothetical protein
MKRKGYEFLKHYHPLVTNREGGWDIYLGMTQSPKVFIEGKYTNKTSKITLKF